MSSLQLDREISPSSQYDHFEDFATAECLVCKKQAVQPNDGDGWFPESSIENYGNGLELVGQGYEFDDAETLKDGWVCSKACHSQHVYNTADAHDKKTLDRVRDACHVIDSEGKRAIQIVTASKLDVFITDNLRDAATEFLEAIDDANCPEWCNKEPEDERIVEEIRKQIGELEFSLKMLRYEIGYMRDDGHTWPWRADNLQSIADSIAKISSSINSEVLHD